MTTYNKTQLNPDTCFERHVFHRDQFAHYLRWTHALKRLELGMNVLDFGCGSGNMAEVMYRNRYKGNCYLGLDIRKQTIKTNEEKFKNVPWIYFKEVDLCSTYFKLPLSGVNPEKSLLEIGFDLITCFEVAEHITKKNVPQFLTNIKKCCSSKTTLLISTPCFDESVGAADNHIINGEVCEMTYLEFKNYLIIAGFEIINKWGTFASKRDYKKLIPEDLLPYFNKLNEYYDDNLISNLMAPLFPEQSRNVLWECKTK